MITAIDLEDDYYWEYGEIAKNVADGKGYALYHWNGTRMDNRYSPDADPLPSAYMPPGYVLFLVPVFLLDDVVFRKVAVLVVQILISCAVVLLLYRFSERMFGAKVAVIASAIYALTPEFAFGTMSLTPTVFYHAGVLLILTILYQSGGMLDRRDAMILGILFGVMVYFRSESIAFAALVCLVLALRSETKSALTIGLVMMMVLLPWQVRNYRAFDRIVPLTTNGGLNFYRGHNPDRIGAWPSLSLTARAYHLKDARDYEARVDSVYYEAAFQNIGQEPWREVTDLFRKILHLWILNPHDPRTSDPPYAVPWIGILLAFGVGFWRSLSWHQHKYTYAFLLFSSLIAMLFFALPRYQTMMKIAVLPFAAHGIAETWRFLQERMRRPEAN